MDFSNIKMVVSDMDGTLLNSNHEVSHRFFELFDALREKQIQFVAASGRQYHSMVDKLKTIKDDVIFIAENGAFTKQKEDVLLTTPIDKINVSEVLSALSNVPDAHPVLCCNNKAYANGHSNDFLNLLAEYYTEFEAVSDQTKVNDQVLKVAIYHFENSEKHIYPAVKHLEGPLKVKVSGSNWVDVSHKNAHKGYALGQLMHTYGLSADEVMVFGDYNNDLEMLELSNYSFAMSNAHPDVKKISKFETSSNNDFGVERILEQLV
ncbi:HAD family hydrolase [Flagellimonas sp. 2504JD1-5]